jgi:hypothetical protein
MIGSTEVGALTFASEPLYFSASNFDLFQKEIKEII